MNQHEADARARKVRRLYDHLLVNLLLSGGDATFPKLEALRDELLKWRDAEWSAAAEAAGVNMPSEETRRQVVYEVDLRLPRPRPSRGIAPNAGPDVDEPRDRTRGGG